VVVLDTTGKIVMVIIGLAIIAFAISLITNYISQLYYCGKVDNSKALSGGIPSAVSVLLGGIISSISYCRIPVASVFTPLLVGKSVDVTKNTGTANITSLKNTNSKECCVPKFTLENIETNSATKWHQFLNFCKLLIQKLANTYVTIE
jgi:hypothetical protein